MDRPASRDITPDRNVGAAARALYTYTARAGRAEALRDVLIEACHAVRNDPGMRGLTLARSINHPDGFIVFSRWSDRLTLTECFVKHRDSGLTGRIAAECATYSLDVLVPDDPPGALPPSPDRMGAVIASRLSVPRPAHVAEARALMRARADVARSAKGCLWVQASVHADRDDYLFLCTGWESRDALAAALEEYPLPQDWHDPGRMARLATLDLLEPILEIVPDRLSPAGEQDRR